MVATGSCVDPLTETPRCAVDEDSCDPGDGWVDAASTAAAGTACVLCDAGDLVWPTSSPTTAGFAAQISGFGGAKFGGCYDGTLNARRCEYNATYCGPSEVWKTPTELSYLGVEACSCEDTEIGACYDVAETHVATCHVHANQCPDGYYWIEPLYVYYGGHTCTCDMQRRNRTFSGMRQVRL